MSYGYIRLKASGNGFLKQLLKCCPQSDKTKKIPIVNKAVARDGKFEKDESSIDAAGEAKEVGSIQNITFQDVYKSHGRIMQRLNF